MEQCGTPERNTKKMRSVFLTWNNYDEEDWKTLIKFCDEKSKKARLQKECGKEGTKHIQGYIMFNNPISFNKLKKDFPKVHFEVPINHFACINYCKKLDTFDDEGYSKNIDKPAKCRNPLENKELYGWQKWIIGTVEQYVYDDRKIWWIVDPIGNRGKTALAKYLCMNYGALYLEGAKKDVLYAVHMWLKKHDLKVCIFDFCRSTEGFVSYGAIESIKNGIFFNSKYEAEMNLFDPPLVLCFSNFWPDSRKLSKDRWEIIDISYMD